MATYWRCKLISAISRAPARNPVLVGNAQDCKRTSLALDNLHGASGLVQCSIRPIENISASLSLSLKTKRILLSLSNFDPRARTALYSQPDSWVALRRLREYCILVFSRWI